MKKSNKGITLVALIITIIVLLILAVVAIRAVTGDGIIAHAKNARDNYNRAQIEENGTIQNYADYITGQVGGQTSSEPELSAIKIGDKVAYDEGYDENKTNTVDSNFKMDDMDWRVLDVDETNKTVKLISTRPTTQTLGLLGEQDWLNAETKLDTLCSELYTNGKGVKARSLKVEDINKLANYDPTTYGGYGDKYQYRYSTEAESLQYRKSIDNGITWNPDWADISTNSSLIFVEPGQTVINNKNTTRIADLTSSDYLYSITDKIPSTIKTEDDIAVADLITRGLNAENNARNSKTVKQWLSSRSIRCGDTYAQFCVRMVFGLNVQSEYLIISNSAREMSVSYAVRPLVIIPLSAFTTKTEGTWQLNI